MLKEMSASSNVKKCSARDQGHLNYIYYNDKLQGVSVLVEKRGEGVVNTAGYIPQVDIMDEMRFDGMLLNKDGTISAVVHQYDRFDILTQLSNMAASSWR